MLANPPLQEAVIASLERDSRIPDPLTIAVSAQGNVVTLRGKVERDCWVTLTGHVEYEPQVLAAYDQVAAPDGVTGISHEIKPLGY